MPASRSQRNIALIPLLRFLLDQKGPIARTPRDQPLPSLSKQLETHDLEKANQIRELISKCNTLQRGDVEKFLEEDLYSWLMETHPAWNEKVSTTPVSHPDPDKDQVKKMAALLGKG